MVYVTHSNIEKKPFVNYTLDDNPKEKPDIFTVRLNKEERMQLDRDKIILNQSKDSTAYKQLVAIGSNVLHDTSTGKVINIVFENKRKNKRLGINEFG